MRRPGAGTRSSLLFRGRTPGAALSGRERVVLLLGLAALVVFPLVAAAFERSYLITFVCRILIFSLAAVSLDLLVGFAGLISIGHAAFFGLGGYVVAILSFHASEGSAFLGLIPGTQQFLLAIPAAVAIAALAAFGLGGLALRTRGVNFIMITLAFAQMVYFLFVSLVTYGGDDGLIMRQRDLLPLLDLRSDTTYYYLSLAALVAFLWLCRRLVASRFGMVLIGCRDNERRMQALGYEIYGYKLLTFTIAGAGAGLAGAFLTNLDKFASPDMLQWTRSGDLLNMVIIGGVGTLYGSLFGALAIIGLETFLSAMTDHWMVFLGPILVVTILFFDQGLYRAIRTRGGGDG